jgi:predicted nucleic acid-binding protein/DNA-binding XRE family transcriptional regulator
MRYLVDTDWLIDVLSGLNAAAATLQQLSGDGVGLIIVTLGELYEGAALDPDPVAAKERYKTFVAPFPVLPLTVPIMERFAELRGQLRQSGALLPDFDLLKLRRHRGLTQKQLDRMTGIPQSEISRIESGRANPTLATLRTLVRALGGEIRIMEKPDLSSAAR